MIDEIKDALKMNAEETTMQPTELVHEEPYPARRPEHRVDLDFRKIGAYMLLYGMVREGMATPDGRVRLKHAIMAGFLGYEWGREIQSYLGPVMAGTLAFKNKAGASPQDDQEKKSAGLDQILEAVQATQHNLTNLQASISEMSTLYSALHQRLARVEERITE